MDPSILVSRFAAELGWRGITRTDITLTADNHGNLPIGTVVTCFSTNDIRFFIQINQAVTGQFGKYNVSVAAERYNIRSMNFEVCEFDSIAGSIAEASRLAPLFARSNFKNPKWRRQYLEQNPTRLLRKKKWRGWKARIGT